jgi:hypothetical protein
VKKRKSEVISFILRKPGLRARINAHCVACIYDNQSVGTWRKQVEDCTVEDCSLYDFRAKCRHSAANSNLEHIDRVLVSQRAEGSETQQFDSKEKQELRS